MVILTAYSGVWAYIKLILVFVFILLLAYYGAKLAGNYQNNVFNSKSDINVIESFRIGGNKLIAIVKIGADYYAVGVGKDEFTLIDKLDSEYFSKKEFADKTDKMSEKLSFSDVLKKKKKQEDK